MTQRSPVVLVTGVSSGIGLAVAGAFAAKGFEVFGTSRNPERMAPIPRVDLVELDVIGAASESSIAQAQQLFDTNFFGLVRLTREVLPYLRAQGSGRIINISSVLGFLPAPYGALYAASKHAVETFETNAADADTPIDSYAATREQVRRVLTEAVHVGDDPSVVAQVVLRAATSRKPKVRYPAGPMARRLSLLKRYAPATLLDKGIRKANKLTTQRTNHNLASKETAVGVFPNAAG